jgi:hypothetical protein
VALEGTAARVLHLLFLVLALLMLAAVVVEHTMPLLLQGLAVPAVLAGVATVETNLMEHLERQIPVAAEGALDFELLHKISLLAAQAVPALSS